MRNRLLVLLVVAVAAAVYVPLVAAAAPSSRHHNNAFLVRSHHHMRRAHVVHVAVVPPGLMSSNAVELREIAHPRSSRASLASFGRPNVRGPPAGC